MMIIGTWHTPFLTLYTVYFIFIPPFALFLQPPVRHSMRHLQSAIFSSAYRPHRLTPDTKADTTQKMKAKKFCLRVKHPSGLSQL